MSNLAVSNSTTIKYDDGDFSNSRLESIGAVLVDDTINFLIASRTGFIRYEGVLLLGGENARDDICRLFENEKRFAEGNYGVFFSSGIIGGSQDKRIYSGEGIVSIDLDYWFDYKDERSKKRSVHRCFDRIDHIEPEKNGGQVIVYG